MSYTITEIEDAIIATLKASEMGGYCKKIDSYQIEGGDLEEQIRIFAGMLPCALVIYNGGDYSYGMEQSQEKKMTFSILLCAQSLRGDGSARRGSVGVYFLLDQIRSILSFNRLDLDIDELIPVGERPEINTKTFSAYSIDFETQCTY